MLSKGVRPQNPAQHLRGSSRRCSGAGQDRGVQAIMPRQETCRDAVCAFEAYPTARPAAIARAMRCPVRVHVGSDCAEPSQACQVGRPATTTRPCVLCVTLQASVKSSVSRPAQSSGWQRTASTNGIGRPAPSVCRLLQQNLPKAKLTLLDRTPMIFRLHALHAWKLSDDAVLIEHFQAKLDIREHDISRTPDDEI